MLGGDVELAVDFLDGLAELLVLDWALPDVGPSACLERSRAARLSCRVRLSFLLGSGMSQFLLLGNRSLYLSGVGGGVDEGAAAVHGGDLLFLVVIHGLPLDWGGRGGFGRGRDPAEGGVSRRLIELVPHFDDLLLEDVDGLLLPSHR